MAEWTTKLFVLNMLVSCISACSVTEWRKLSMEESLSRFDIVVTGTDMKHVKREEAGMILTDSEFRVSCVLKGDRMPVNENITILEIEPMNSCQVTETRVGQGYIVGLKREGSSYRRHDLGVLQTSAFPMTETSVRKALSVCGVQNPLPPSGETDNRCPDISLVEPCVSGAGHIPVRKLLVIISCIFLVFFLG